MNETKDPAVGRGGVSEFSSTAVDAFRNKSTLPPPQERHGRDCGCWDCIILFAIEVAGGADRILEIADALRVIGRSPKPLPRLWQEGARAYHRDRLLAARVRRAA